MFFYMAKLQFHQSPIHAAQWLHSQLDSDSVVTVDNCRQHGDYTIDPLHE